MTYVIFNKEIMKNSFWAKLGMLNIDKKQFNFYFRVNFILKYYLWVRCSLNPLSFRLIRIVVLLLPKICYYYFSFY